MNRRDFFQATIGALVATLLARKALPAPAPPSRAASVIGFYLTRGSDTTLYCFSFKNDMVSELLGCVRYVEGNVIILDRTIS